MHLKLLFASHADPAIAAFRIDKADAMSVNLEGQLVVQLGDDFRLSPKVIYPQPQACQGSSTSDASVQTRFELRTNQQFGFSVHNRDPTLPLEIEIKINPWLLYNRVAPSTLRDPSGNLFVAATIPGPGGAEPPFPDMQGDGCGTSIGVPYACTDISISKFTPQGQLAFVTYLSGRRMKCTGFFSEPTMAQLWLQGPPIPQISPSRAAPCKPNMPARRPPLAGAHPAL
jgi:hypothetical protein